jgi:hypothetical protein
MGRSAAIADGTSRAAGAAMNPRTLLAMLLCLSTGCSAVVDDESHEMIDESADEASVAALRFDLATLNCSADPAAVCAQDDDKCFCKGDFDLLNHASQRHFLIVGTDKHKAEINGAGNFQAAYWDTLNVGWLQHSAVAHADMIMAKLEERMPSGVPKWIHLNELSAGTWPVNAEYRDYVVEVVKRLKNTYGKKVVVYSPFFAPGHHSEDWSRLAKAAYIGAELYLSGKEINAHGNSIAWCRGEYQRAIDAYASVGVPKERLMILEHFGQTLPDKGWGRAGVSHAGWRNAISARTKAAQQLDFAGYVSYAWGTNGTFETSADRQGYIELYRSFLLP